MDSRRRIVTPNTQRLPSYAKASAVALRAMAGQDGGTHRLTDSRTHGFILPFAPRTLSAFGNLRRDSQIHRFTDSPVPLPLPRQHRRGMESRYEQDNGDDMEQYPIERHIG